MQHSVFILQDLIEETVPCIHLSSNTVTIRFFKQQAKGIKMEFNIPKLY